MKVKDAMHKGVDWFSPDIRNVELGRYGKALIGPLRKAYGSFAPHCADDERLSDVLHKNAKPHGRRGGNCSQKHSESGDNLLIGKGSGFSIFSECALI